MEGGLRRLASAGRFFPEDAAALERFVAPARAAAGFPQPARAIVAPHAGYRFSGATAALAWASARGRAWRRAVILSPSHHCAFRGVAAPGCEGYATPLGPVAVDRAALGPLLASAAAHVHEPAHARSMGSTRSSPSCGRCFPRRRRSRWWSATRRRRPWRRRWRRSMPTPRR
jgi:AmmeMemoRadiSam system protein B